MGVFLYTKLVAALIIALVMLTRAELRHRRHRENEKLKERSRSNREIQSGTDRFKVIEVMRFPGKKFQFVELNKFISPNQNVNSLSFQFRTGGGGAQSCGRGEVVLYLDDGGATNYVKLSIKHNGIVVFNYKLMERETAKEAKFEVSACNGLWHDVKLDKETPRKISITVDEHYKDFFLKKRRTARCLLNKA